MEGEMDSRGGERFRRLCPFPLPSSISYTYTGLRRLLPLNL